MIGWAYLVRGRYTTALGSTCILYVHYCRTQPYRYAQALIGGVRWSHTATACVGTYLLTRHAACTCPLDPGGPSLLSAYP